MPVIFNQLFDQQNRCRRLNFSSLFVVFDREHLSHHGNAQSQLGIFFFWDFC